MPLNEFADMVATWSAILMADFPCEESTWKVGHFAACFAASRQAFQKKPKRIAVMPRIRIGKQMPIMMIHIARGISAMVVPRFRRRPANLLLKVYLIATETPMRQPLPLPSHGPVKLPKSGRIWLSQYYVPPGVPSLTTAPGNLSAPQTSSRSAALISFESNGRKRN